MTNRIFLSTRFFFITRWMMAGILFLILNSAWAQEPKKEGEIQSVQYEIVVDKKNTVPPATRNFSPVVFPSLNKQKFPIPYKPATLDVTPYSAGVPLPKPVKIKDEELTKLYRGYISAGGGNYGQLFANGGYSTKRNKTKLLSIAGSHQQFASGPVDKKNSASNTSSLRFFGEYMLPRITAKSFVNWKQDGGYFYGYDTKPTDRASIRQVYNQYALGLSVENTQTKNHQYQVGINYSYLTDHYAAKESDLRLYMMNDYDLKNSTRVSLNTEFNLIARKDTNVEAKPRYIYKFFPTYTFSPIENVWVTGGINAVFTSDSVDKKTHVYPHARGEYKINSAVKVYTQFSGDVEKVSLHSLRDKNFWVNASIPIYNTNKKWDWQGGVQATVRRLSIHAGWSYAALRNQFFFLNSILHASKFDVVYDRGNTYRMNLFAETDVPLSSSVKFFLRGDWFHYNANIVPQVVQETILSGANRTFSSSSALHLPTYTLTSSLRWNLNKKISGHVEWQSLGGMKSLLFIQPLDVPSEAVLASLKSSNNLNIKIEYWVARHFTVFIQGQNLLNQSYPLYQNYLSRGIQVSGGLWKSF